MKTNYDQINFSSGVHTRVFEDTSATEWLKEEYAHMIVPTSIFCEDWSIQVQDDKGCQAFPLQSLQKYVIPLGKLHRILHAKNKTKGGRLVLLVFKEHLKELIDQDTVTL